MRIDIFLTAFQAITPLLLLILLGYWLKRIGFLTEPFTKNGNKLVFSVLLPATLFYNIYSISGFTAINWSVVIFSVGGVTALFGISLLAAVLGTPVPQRRGVISQAIFRSNFAIIGLSLANALGGQEAMAVAAIVSGFTIPVFNVFAVIALTVFVKQPGDSHPLRNTLKSILRNPQIIGALAGLAALLVREAEVWIFGEAVFTIQVQLPFLYKALKDLTGITTTFALVILGADFTFSALKGTYREVAIGSIFRLIVAPLLALGSAFALNRVGILSFGVNEYAAMIALFGSPTAVSGAVMAKQMGGDGDLATQLVVWTSIFSIITIFLQVCILAAAGLI